MTSKQMPLNASKPLDVEALRKPMEDIHESGVNYSYEWRVKQLKAVEKLLVDHKQEWQQAVYTDLHKDPTEFEITEALVVEWEIKHLLKNLWAYMKPTKVAGPAFCAVQYSEILKRPLGSPGVVVIGAFNYPVHLTLLPLVGALAGGNPTLVKPSELCPAVSALLAELVPRYFPNREVQVIEGSVDEVTSLLKHPWGTVLFTGSERVGRIVAQATAKTLTPTILELGGKSPVVIDESSPTNMYNIANRIVWGKTYNAGQTCIAPDYVVCHESHVNELCKYLVEAVDYQFGKDPFDSELGRIVTVEHAQRLIDMIKEVEQDSTSKTTKVMCGGSNKCLVDKKYVCPTIVLNPPATSGMLSEEIFGPILPIVVVKSRQEAIDFIKKQHGTPLAMYVFTRSNAVYKEILQACPSGGACRNELLMHCGNLYLPFGGLGTSGYGKYHGKFSFDTFTHAFPSLHRPCFAGSDFMMVRCHAYQGVRSKILDLLAQLPDVPVLHSKRLLLLLFVALAVVFGVPSAWKDVAWHAVGNTLQRMADWTQPSGTKCVCVV